MGGGEGVMYAVVCVVSTLASQKKRNRIVRVEAPLAYAVCTTTTRHVCPSSFPSLSCHVASCHVTVCAVFLGSCHFHAYIFLLSRPCPMGRRQCHVTAFTWFAQHGCHVGCVCVVVTYGLSHTRTYTHTYTHTDDLRLAQGAGLVEVHQFLHQEGGAEGGELVPVQ